MFILLKKLTKKLDRYLLLCFLIGLLPASFIIHVIPVDFVGFYYQAISFLKYHEYSYQVIINYCNNPLNSGLNARAPLVPLLMAGSIGLFGQTLLGIYLPFFLARTILVPMTFLVARNFLSPKIAFLAALLTILLPKLQTYSFASPEADVFVALFYASALFFYAKTDLNTPKYAVLTGLSLGLAALAKSTGLGVAVGFLIAISLKEKTELITKKIPGKNFLLLIISFICLIGPYLLWTILMHKQLYITTQNDKSIFYIIQNLPSLLATIPLYLGMNFTLGTKALVTTLGLLFIFAAGIIRTIIRKQFTLLLPTLITLIFISTLETCAIGFAIPFNYEFASILGFAMIAMPIVFFSGVASLLSIIQQLTKNDLLKRIIINLFILLVMFKFINNFFTAQYALDFIPDEYYISLPTLIKNRDPLPEPIFSRERNLLIFKGPQIHKLIRNQFTNFRFKPFSRFYKHILLFLLVFSLWTVVFDHNRKKG